MQSEPERRAISERIEVRATAADHFAWLRTRLAVERTMMAWVRTGASLIGFGFTIVQFFDRIESLANAAPAKFPEAPHYLGLALIGCGVVSLAGAIWDYLSIVSYLWSAPYTMIAGVRGHRSRTPILFVTVVLMLVGLFAFFAVYLRLL